MPTQCAVTVLRLFVCSAALAGPVGVAGAGEKPGTASEDAIRKRFLRCHVGFEKDEHPKDHPYRKFAIWGARYLAGRKDKTVVDNVAHGGKRSLHVKLIPGVSKPPGRSQMLYCAPYMGLHPEDGKTYVVKFRMKTRFPQGARLHLHVEQKGHKDGKSLYFRVGWPEPRSTWVDGSDDWKAFSWEFVPKPRRVTAVKTFVALFFQVFGPEGTEAWLDDIEIWEKPVLYRTDFGGADGAKLGWRPSGPGASVDTEAGHASKPCLRIRAHANTKQSPYWESDPIPVPTTDVRLSCRMRGRFTFSPDPTYNAHCRVRCFDKDNKLIKEYPQFVSIWSGYCPVIGNRLLGWRAQSWMHWHYLTRKQTLPAATRHVKLRFGFRHSYLGDDVATTGDVWLDDVTLEAGMATAESAIEGPYREHAWPVWDNRRMRIHTPVFMNLFLPTDKLWFDVVVLDRSDELDDRNGVTLEYTVEDFYHAVVAADTIANPAFAPVPEARLKAARVNRRLYRAARWTHVVLPPAVANPGGRWLRFHCRVMKGGKRLAEGRTNFGTLRPAAPASESKKDRSKFAVGLGLFSPAWGRCPPAQGARPRPIYPELFGFYWKRAGYINSWSQAQPQKDGPIDWSKVVPERLFRQGLLTKGVNNRAYIFFNSIRHGRPKWADGPNVKTHRDSCDPDAFAQWVGAVVGRYKGSGIMWMAGLSETRVNQEQAHLARVGYEAAKKADPDATIFCSGITGINNMERTKLYLDLGHLDFTDALDLHFYYSDTGTEHALDYIRERMQREGKVKPMWSAEIGSFCRDFETLCKDMVKKHVIAFACGMRNVCWHCFSTSGQQKKICPMWRFYYLFNREAKLSAAWSPDATPPGHYTVPLPRLFTLNNLLRDLDYVVPRRKYVRDDDVRVYVFDRERETVVALWRHGKRGKNMLLATGVPVHVRDTFGLLHTLEPGPVGGVCLPANDNPRLVSIPAGLAKVSLGNGPLAVTAPPKVSGAQPFDVRVTVTNRFAKPLTGHVALELDRHWRVVPARVALDLAPGASRQLAFRVNALHAKRPGRYRFLVPLKSQGGQLLGYHEFYVTVGQ